MELNTDGELNTGGTNSTGGTGGMNTLDYSVLADGSALPSEVTFTTGGGEILDGGLKATDTSTGGGDYFEVDSAADGKFVARIFTAASGGQSSTFVGVRFRISDPDNYHILMWQSKDNAIARIGKFVNGSSSYTDLNAVIEGVGAKPVILVVANGSSIQGYIGDETNITDIEDPNDAGFTQVADITDTFNQTATKAGMRIGSTSYRVAEFRYATEGGAPVNQAPVVNAGSGLTGVTAGSTVQLAGSATDSDGTIASYQWIEITTSGVTINNANSANASYTAPSEAFAQDLTFQLVATDNEGVSGSDSVIHKVLAQEVTQTTPPTANAGPTQSVTAGVPVQLDASSSTPGTYPIASYEWTVSPLNAVTLVNGATATPSFTAPTSDSAQTLNFSVVAIDTEGNRSESASTSVSVAAAVDSVAPVITLTGGNIVLNVGETFQEPGYIAIDDKDGNITDNVVVTGSTDTSYPRSGEIAYNVSDAAGNAAVTKTRLFTVIEVSELLEEVSKQKFTIENKAIIHSFPGRSNLEKVRFKLASTNTNIALDKTGCYDFDENETQKVEVITASGLISSESGDVEWEGGDLYIRAGAFSSMRSHESARVVVYLANDDRGVVFAGPGLPANLIIHFN